MISWILLFIAGAFEIGFTTCLKLSDNFSNLKWSVAFFVCITCSFLFLNKAIQTIPLGTAYAVWTGIGAVTGVISGIIFFNEPATFWRMFFICTLIASVVGLKITQSH